MREILFRGKRVENGEWVYGYYAKYRNIVSEDYTAILQFDKEDGGVVYSDGVTAVIPETVGQYTGLTDKNGKKIFEGDIVFYDVFGCMRKRVVKFSTECGSCGCCGDPFEGAGFMALGVDLNVSEVIGNIYDNPELWEGEQ